MVLAFVVVWVKVKFVVIVDEKHRVEAARAKWWRKNIVHLSRPELATRTGYSVGSIQVFERGYNYNGKAISAGTWKKYRMACAAVHWGCCEFNWENGKVSNAHLPWYEHV